MRLRDYQTDAIEAIKKAFYNGLNRQLAALPTGAGKTVIFSALAKELNVRTLVIAHREELIRQAEEKIRIVHPDATIGIVKAERNEIEANIVIASVQSAIQPKRLAQLADQDFELLIVDEAHHASASSYQRIIEELSFDSSNPQKLLLGVTATPRRADREGLDSVFDAISYEITIAELIRQEYLCDVRGIRIDTKTDLKGIEVRRGDFVESQLARAIDTNERNDLIVEKYQELAAGKKGIVFGVNVRHIQRIAETFRDFGIRAEAIFGDMDPEDRRDALRRFKEGDIDVLTSCGVLTEGFDEPSVEVVLMARPTRSQTLYIQCVGRGLRKHPEKSECLILDFTDRDHSLCQVSTLLGKQPSNGQSFLEYEREERERENRKRRPINPFSSLGSVTLREMDLFDRNRFDWKKGSDGSYRLSLLAKGAILLTRDSEDPDRYIAQHVKDGQLVETITDRSLFIDYAQGSAEDYARRIVGSAIYKDAAWRRQAASPGQKAHLARLGISYSFLISKGEAHDLIEADNLKRDTEKATDKQKYRLRMLGISFDPFTLTKREAYRIIRECTEERPF